MFCAYSGVGSVKAGVPLPSALKETRSDKPGLKLTHEWQPFCFWVFRNKAFLQTIVPLRAHRHYFLQLALNEYRWHICKWQTIWDFSEIMIPTSCRKRPKSSRLHVSHGTRTVRTQGDNNSAPKHPKYHVKNSIIGPSASWGPLLPHLPSTLIPSCHLNSTLVQK